MNPVQHAHLVVKQARAFFDSWFEKFSTWDDFKRSLENNQAPEFGQSAEVEQVDKIGNKIGNLISRAIKNPPAREVRSTVGKLLKLSIGTYQKH